MSARKKSGRMSIFYAISHGKVRSINTILTNQEDCLEQRTDDGKTPLTYAICEAKESIRTHVVRMLIRSGCDVNALDEEGKTALMYACLDNEKIDLVRLIARCKSCEPNIQDRDGNTAVMFAVMCANASAIRILVNSSSTKATINMEVRNKQGLNALELSIKLQMSECCKVLVCEGRADTKQVKNQVGLMRLLEDENLIQRTHTPHSRSTSRSAFMEKIRHMESPILENKQFEGSYMSRDTTPNYVDDFIGQNGNGTPLQPFSRSNSLHRTNSNLYKRRPEAGTRPSSLSGTSNDVFGLLNSQKNLKRVLTPISGRNGNSPARPVEVSEDESSLSQRTRLPSIPSGRKLYLVSSPTVFNGYNNT